MRGQIMVVDDHQATAELLAFGLSGFGYVKVFSDAFSAGAWLRSGEVPRVAIVDWCLGDGANGLDLVRLIRSDRRFDGIQVAMLTGKVDAQSYGEAAQAGVDRYFCKPVELLYIQRWVAGVFGA